ncbi:MAG: cupin domain-containing protein [Pseudomonadota bacterium]
MKVNADFDERVVVHTAELKWMESPLPGVHRRMLDRVGDEVARATTIVRYAPGSAFSPHTHTGGEEFIVLDGVFQDEHGDFPAGSYVRNPPSTAHTPRSEHGCTIFVKLWQFDPDDRHQMNRVMADELSPPVEGVATALLYQDDKETVRYSDLNPGSTLSVRSPGGAELLVIDGSVCEGEDTLHRWDWLRVPSGRDLLVVAEDTDAKVWFKTGHLASIQVPV